MVQISHPVILYVEDDPNSQKVIEILIRQVMGFKHLTIFTDTEKFADRLRILTPKPNLIFLDLQLRPIDGYEAITIIRQELSSTTRVIAMTANVMSHDVVQLREFGFNGLIGKPIISNVFPRLVETILEGKEVWYIP